MGVPFVDSLDRQSYDARLRSANADRGAQVIIVDIDERALAEVGRWPWSRGTMAQMAQALSQRGQARTIAFDVLFAETQSEAGQDEALARVIGQAPVVLGYYLSNDREGRTNGQLPPPAFSAELVQSLDIPVHVWSGYGANLPMLQSQARGAGFFSPILDDDGVVRRLPLIGRYDAQFYESFPIAVLRHFLGSASMALSAEALVLSGAQGRLSLPVSVGASVLVPYAGAGMVVPDAPFSGRFDVISAADVVSGKVDWTRFKDRIALIGTSAPGLSDLRATPISRATAGVEIHATLIAGALASADPVTPIALKQWPQDAALLSLGVTAVVGLVLALLMPAAGLGGILWLGALAVAAIVGWNTYAFSQLNLFLPGAATIVLVFALAGLNLVWGYFIESRARRAVAELFGEYVSPAVVEHMTRDPSRFGQMGSENRKLTILFADIRGFTRISESMEPEQLREFINEFLTVMTECIHEHHGTVDKYIGDAVMAFWGAPLPDERHADHAVAAALAMSAAVERMNGPGRARGWPTLSVGIGINTGIARVGDMGSKLRRAYTVLGDSVNLASRLEALTKQFNTPIIVGETTAAEASAHRFDELAQVTVAGRSESTRIFVPASLASTRSLPARTAQPAVAVAGSQPLPVLGRATARIDAETSPTA